MGYLLCQSCAINIAYAVPLSLAMFMRVPIPLLGTITADSQTFSGMPGLPNTATQQPVFFKMIFQRSPVGHIDGLDIARRPCSDHYQKNGIKIRIVPFNSMVASKCRCSYSC